MKRKPALGLITILLGSLAAWPAGSSVSARPQEKNESLARPVQGCPERPMQQRMGALPLAETRSGSAPGTVSSPTWAKSYGGFLASAPSGYSEYDRPRRVVEAFDGNLLVGGSASFESSDPGDSMSAILVMKLTRTGEVKWRGVFPAQPSKTYSYYGENLVATRDGGCLVIGDRVDTKSGTIVTTPLILKLGPEGTVEWQESPRLSGDWSSFVKGAAELTDGRFAMAGGGHLIYSWVFILDSFGNLSWSKLLDSPAGTGETLPRVVKATADGGFVVAGASRTGRAELLKFSAGGGLEWQKSYVEEPREGYQIWSAGLDLAVTPSGGYLLYGMTSHFNDFEASQDFWVSGLDSSGGIQWQKGYTYIGGGDTMIPTLDSGCVIMSARADKLDGQGGWQWARRGTQFDISTGCQLSDGGFVWAGGAAAGTPVVTFVLARTDFQGLMGGSCAVLVQETDSESDRSVHTVSATPMTAIKHSPSVSSLSLTRRSGPVTVEVLCADDATGTLIRYDR